MDAGGDLDRLDGVGVPDEQDLPGAGAGPAPGSTDSRLSRVG
ncbi:hypothetical protein [Streptomyces sp. CBMA123]|nr:hypothetical protein [Streptomyces sp. CBMA123]